MVEIALDILSEEFLNTPTEENGNRLVGEIVRLIQEHKSILIDVIKDENNTSQPSGYMGPDQRFYIHIFSSMERFEVSTATNPVWVDMHSLYELIQANNIIGGFSLNHVANQGTIRITREDITAYKK